MKKFLSYFIFMVTVLFVGIGSVMAESKGTLEIATKDITTVGDQLEVKINIKDIEGNSVAGLAAKLIYDDTKLEYVKYNTSDTIFPIAVNEKILKFGGLSLNGNYIEKEDQIITFIFNVKESGQVKLSLTEIDVVDNLPERTKVEAIDKIVTIKEKVVTPVVIKNEIKVDTIKKENVKHEDKEEVKEEVKEIIVEPVQEIEEEPVITEKEENNNSIITNIINSVVSFFKKIFKF